MKVPRLALAIDLAAWVALAIAGAVLVSQVVGTPFGLVAMAQSVTPFAVPILTLIAVAGSLTRRHGIGVAAAALGLGYLAVVAPLVFAGSGPAPDPDSPRVSIVAANLLYSNDRIDGAADALQALDADVLALSEVTPEILRALEGHRIADRYPHRVDRPAPLASGLVLWSRLPLGPVGEQPDFRRAIDTTVITGDGLVRLLLVHPPPPVFALDQWHAELEAIPSVASETLFPTVVLGDFNASHFHTPFRRMVGDAELRSALVAQGHPFTPTWPTDSFLPPFTPLDHILVQQTIAVVDAGTVDIPGSDHRAVTATVALAAN